MIRRETAFSARNTCSPQNKKALSGPMAFAIHLQIDNNMVGIDGIVKKKLDSKANSTQETDGSLSWRPHASSQYDRYGNNHQE
jgi:hypothetical protein